MHGNTMTLKLLVDNEFGVLTRITALIRREGLNIKSLAVEVTENPELSQVLISVECIINSLPKVLSRLNKLGCVKKAVQVSERFDLSKQLQSVFDILNEIEEDDLKNDRQNI